MDDRQARNSYSTVGDWGPVPHSGNTCSGLCRTPCVHTDCWQCQEYLLNHELGVPDGGTKKVSGMAFEDMAAARALLQFEGSQADEAAAKHASKLVRKVSPSVDK